MAFHAVQLVVVVADGALELRGSEPEKSRGKKEQRKVENIAHALEPRCMCLL
jgi:hypothetical protein